MLRIIMALILGGAPLPAWPADHRPLLPQPREIRYGAGEIALRGFSIQVPAGAAAEDIFAAQTLSACLGSRPGGSIPISSGNPGTPALVLRRTGAVGAL